MDELEERLSLFLNHNISIPESGAMELAAAVLILLVKENDDWKIVYTRRTTGVRTHQGEVSFPGGAYEIGDESMVQTALRETYEEIGVNPECIRIIGGLEPIRTISNFMVYPFVGIMECDPEFLINPDEVERLFMIPLKWLRNPDNFYEQDHLVENRYVRKVIHYLSFDGEHLWGLTARITQQLLEIN
jgi:8-oxo-dGTP pyrophosphatase MutT (NUDIX family)